jgi:hypothetical protein
MSWKEDTKSKAKEVKYLMACCHHVGDLGYCVWLYQMLLHKPSKHLQTPRYLSSIVLSKYFTMIRISCLYELNYCILHNKTLCKGDQEFKSIIRARTKQVSFQNRVDIHERDDVIFSLYLSRN